MFKRNLRFSVVVIGILLSCLLMTGCKFSFFNITVKTLDTPVVGLNRENKELNWHSIDKADKYNIYINNEVVDTVDSVPTSPVQSYSFASDLNSFGNYKLKVQAISENANIKESLTSISVTYVYANIEREEILTDYNTTYYELEKSPSNIELVDETISWMGVEDATHYVVIAYTSLHGVTTYAIEHSTFNIASITNDEIVLFSVGAYFEVDNVLYIDSPLRYFYNPYSEGSYTEKVYTFDGYIGDHYIQSMEELANITYYHFVNKATKYDIRFAESFLQDVGIDKLSSTRINEELLKKIDLCFAIATQTGPFFETAQFRSVGSRYGKKLDGELDYQITLDFYGVEECDIDYDSRDYGYPPFDQHEVENPYYEGFLNAEGRRLPDYDDFISDKYFVTTEVSTSEQLYWAVENRVTPIVKEDSRAELIYEMAKEVLREIIHPSMTDYEKALSIFDWITVNTAYDNADIIKIHNDSKKSAQPTVYITHSPAYFLEGVFIQGVAVCDGFSKAYSLLCNMEGIECIRITGMAGGEHAWNKVSIDGNYYLVDITWTEIKGKYSDGTGGREYLTHKYFLFSEHAPMAVHKAYANREKFSNYATALNNYNYYKNKVVKYTNEFGNVVSKSYVISSDEHLNNLMRYFLINNTSSADVIFTKEYIAQLIARRGEAYITPKTIQDALLYEGLQKQKLNAQMLDTACDYDNGFYLFDNSGTTSEYYGIVFYMGFNLMIDEEGELENFVDYIDAISAFTPAVKENEYSRFYFNENIINDIAGGSIQEKINTYIANLNLTDKIEIEFSNKYKDQKFANPSGESTIERTYLCKLTFK